MADADIPLVTGTDTPSVPGLVPGFSLHEELHALEQDGPRRSLTRKTRLGKRGALRQPV